MSTIWNPALAAALAVCPLLTPAQEQQAAIDRAAAHQRAELASRLGVSADDLDRQHLASVATSVDALSLQVQTQGEQRSRIEQSLGLKPGSLKA